MPAGLGFHPYFPCNAQTRYLGPHRGEWKVTSECLPIELADADAPIDWWHGQPVVSRRVDTAHTGRAGPLEIVWPDRGMSLRLEPSDNLPVTVVYTAAAYDHFCVEPVSHATDAINRGGMAMQTPGETMTVSLCLSPRVL